jgi:hypothetical protein
MTPEQLDQLRMLMAEFDSANARHYFANEEQLPIAEQHLHAAITRVLIFCGDLVKASEDIQ